MGRVRATQQRYRRGVREYDLSADDVLRQMPILFRSSAVASEGSMAGDEVIILVLDKGQD